MKKACLEKGISPSSGISLARAFIIFVLVIMGLSGLLICGLVAFTVEREFADITKKDQQQRMGAINNIVKSFTGHQHHILQDHARFPIMTQAVMQPESHLDRVSDFMETMSFLGKKYQLVLLDCYGSTINSTMAQPQFDYAQQKWVLDSQIEMNSYFCSVSEKDEAFYWRLVAPVLYNDLVQGFLVAEIPISEIYTALQLGSLLSSSQLEILYHGKRVSIAGNTDGEVMESAIDDTGISLRYTSSLDEITAARNVLILRIIGLLSVLIVMTIVIAVWVGKKIFVKPLEALRAMTSALSHKESKIVNSRVFKIKEIKSLSTDFEIMAKEVREREQQLQQINAELEVRVQERTKQLQKSHESLEDAAQQWRNTFDSAQDVILVYDENLTVVRANYSATVLFGKTFEHLIGKTYQQLFHSSSFAIDECELERIQNTKQHHETEIQFTGPDKWRLSSADPILDNSGNLCGIVHFLRNITKSKQIQEMLRESKDRLELVLKGADLGMWDWNLQTGEVVFNQRWAQMLDYGLNEIEPHVRSWEKLVHPDDMPEITELLNVHFEGKSPFYESEHRLRTKSGDWKWVLDRGKVVQWDLNGKPLRMAGTHFDITEQKNVTRQLEESKTNLRSFFDSVENMLSVMDMQGTIIEVNKSLRKRLGYSEKELIGRNILTLHPEPYHQQAKEIVRQMMEGKAKTCPLPLITKDGHYIPAETYVVKGLWSEQEVLFGVSKDLSKLKESEEKFSKAFHCSATLMAISTIESGKFIEVNDRFLQTLGYRREEVIGKTSEEIGLFADAGQRGAVKQIIQKQGHVRDYELKICTKQGDLRYALFSADLLQLQGNRYFLTVANDITDLRNSQKKLHDSERRLRTLIETLPDLVWLKDIEGVYLTCNPKFERFFGAKETDIIGKTDYDFVDKNMADSFRHNDNQAIAADKPVINEEEITYADDKHTALMETIKTPVRNSEGQLIGILGIARDITHRKQSENALRQAHNTLEEKVRQRTAQLQQSQHQLRKLYSRLQSTQEKDRKQISREIHDELGTVLTALKYDLAWVKRKLTNPSAVIVEKINTMSATVDSVVETVQNICAQLRPSLLDDMGLAAAIEWHANKFAKMAGFACKTDLEENIDLDQDCSTVLFRISQELLTNILRHAKADKVQISLKQQGSKVSLEVEDNGIGIGKEQILDSRSLGLIGMRERVIIYGGSFEIKGSPGEGTIATVIIPIEKGLDNDKDIDM